MLTKSVRVAAILGLMAGYLAVPAAHPLQAQSRAEKRAEAKLRSVSGLISGTDDMPAAGAVVQLKDMHTMQVRSFITQADGTYHFYELKTDTDYQISARSGDATAPAKTVSVFDTRKEVILNFKLETKK
jgi:Carboxypeptidase regulatory-like domain